LRICLLFRPFVGPWVVFLDNVHKALSGRDPSVDGTASPNKKRTFSSSAVSASNSFNYIVYVSTHLQTHLPKTLLFPVSML
jgi:hypothetical protein